MEVNKNVDFDYLFECAESAGQTDEPTDACCHLDFAFMHRIYKNLKKSDILTIVNIIEHKKHIQFPPTNSLFSGETV